MAGGSEFLVPVDATAERPLYQQVYDGIREAILDGRLAPGRRLPSTRVLAAELGVGRNTVTFAFEQLQLEGYLEGRRGGGTRVRSVVPDRAMGISRPGARIARPGPAEPTEGRVAPWSRSAGPPRLASRADALLTAGATLAGRGGTPAVPFRLGVAGVDAFPVRLWARLSAQRWRRRAVDLGESHPGGDPALRAAIAEHVVQARGVRCTVDQVMVVTGTQQVLELAVRLLLEPGEAAWVEDPGYSGAVAALRSAVARPVPVPVDDEGLVVAEGIRRAPDARLAYVTPSHQFPLGAVMSAPRRLALFGWARAADAWIIEDDYDSEFRYAGRPLPSLQGLDVEYRPAGARARVIYVGSFNKTLAPGLRLGYVILPDELVDPFHRARAAVDRQVSSLGEGVLADFIGEGHYARHVRRLRALYAERQAALLAAAAELEPWLRLQPDPAGLHLVGRLAPGLSDIAVSAAAREAGIEASPLSRFRLEPRPEDPGSLLLGYAPFDELQLRRGVRRLAAVLERCAPA